MDIKKPANNNRRYRRIASLVAACGGVVALGWFAFSLAQRPPGVEKDVLFDGVVTRGEFVHEVTASGSLYAPELRTVTNQSEGIVERVYVLAGQTVGPDEILVELSSPNLLQELADAEAELASAEADETLRKANATDEQLNLQSTLADAQSQFEEAQISANSQRTLAEAEATTELNLQSAGNREEQARRRMEIAQSRLNRYPETRKAEDTQAQAKVDRARRKLDRLRERVSELEVRSGFTGVIQTLEVEEGQRISAGKDVARIVNPDVLIARVRVSERDAALVQEGQPVRLEMGRQTLQGRVTRVEPTVKDRLVTVDVALDGHGHTGLRPDLTVTARIEIARSAETLVLGRPAGLRDDQTSVVLFKLDEAGSYATRVEVEIARVSARHVEVASGLRSGDRVILADMADWLEEPEIRIR
jgi:multidrug efflux pump subunit AcrA (membrane-fusion protein)